VPEADIAAIIAGANRRILETVDVDSAGAGFRGRLLFVGD
jgi:hypothetical protein